MRKVEHLDFAKPDETRVFTHGRAEILNTASGAIGRLVLEPGWRWSNDVKPIAGTEWCEAPHFQFVVSGRLRIRMQDGQEFDLGPGSVSHLPAGHDAWVVGHEPVVGVDWFGATNYAKNK
jgi:quercetin dioxygenase-like cupin family protein